MEVISYLPFLLLIIFPTSPITSQTCGHLNSCDRLIPYFIFQKGACGRAARCNWELLHLEEKLIGDSSNKVTREGKIMESLCNIPTLMAYENIRDNQDDTLEKYHPCGIPPPPPPPPPPNTPPPPSPPLEYPFYPMTTFYTFSETNKRVYLTRMAACAMAEQECTMDLQNLIYDECEKLGDSELKAVEATFKMRLRGKQFYQLAINHRNPQDPPMAKPLNKCSLYHIQRFRKEDGTAGDDTDEPTFNDGYGFNRIDPRLRGPYFDLYILYAADHHKNFAGQWWNETKAYQELAHYLPRDMLDDIHKAIFCVYDRTGAPELVWKPEKFCWNQSTFVCVELAKLKGNVCSGPRHDTANMPVPDWIK